MEERARQFLESIGRKEHIKLATGIKTGEFTITPAQMNKYVNHLLKTFKREGKPDKNIIFCSFHCEDKNPPCFICLTCVFNQGPRDTHKTY
jgi:hypothetical protein